jgi:hypothetical protein
MKVGESAQRARARKVSKKLRFEEAFERVKAELRALTPAPAPVPVPANRRTPDRPIFYLFDANLEPLDAKASCR